LDVLLTVKLSPAISRLYGSHLSIEFHYLLSLFFIRLASKIPVIANLDLFQLVFALFFSILYMNIYISSNSELKKMLTTIITDVRPKASIGGSRLGK
jgi:hypothetical protein